MSNVFVDIHVLQTVPPSNLNRDDTGSPKTAVFGGTRRARVSSQAWKRAVRKDFEKYLDPTDLGVRTKRVVEMVGEHIEQIAPELTGSAVVLAAEALRTIGIKVEQPKTKDGENARAPQSGYLMFVSNLQTRRLAELIVAARAAGAAPDKNEVKKALDSAHSVDISLFGRMIADSKDLSVDASAQVAHAISVHPVDTEFDYFTAVDDRNQEDESGAGMIGTVEFNSSTLYRYATVNLAGLEKNLGDSAATVKAAAAFTRSFIESMPTGKQNTFANRTLPDAVIVSVRGRQPVNLVGAFEDAVVTERGKSRLTVASERLARHAVEMDEAFSQAPLATLVISPTVATMPLEGLGEKVSLDELLGRLKEELSGCIGSLL